MLKRQSCITLKGESLSRIIKNLQLAHARGKGLALPLPERRTQAHILVIYVFSNTDAEYESNLQFFIKHGVKADDGCDYIIVIQTGGASKVVRHQDHLMRS